MDWAAVRIEAEKHVQPLTAMCPRYVDEMRGVAEGAGVDFLDIVALNVRTEITFGLFTLHQPTPPNDGCTSFGYKVSNGDSILAQNWDWQIQQAPNLFVCHIAQPGSTTPSISMVTEGGIIGKIGLNSAGVGVCMNAIRTRGVNTSYLPAHLALRTVLESNSRFAAIEKLKKLGVASSVHFLVADQTGSTGLECTTKGILEIPMDAGGIVVHANNLTLEHPGVDEPPWLEDSPIRTRRIAELVGTMKSGKGSPSYDQLFEVFKDETGYPASINRCQVEGCETQTLFNIIMDMSARKATVTFGRPTDIAERLELVPR